jgi:N-formylglutamate amidohydrolase
MAMIAVLCRLLLMAGLVAVVGAGPVARAEESRLPENPVTGKTGYIQYWPGDLPIVLSAPHGGRLAPKEIPNRPYGRLLRDSGTLELALQVRAALLQQHGRAPHLVVCQLARVKLDCNRDLREAAQGNAVAERAWEEYHAFIRNACEAVARQSGRGLYLDLHGHSHPKQRIELGYLLTAKDLQDADPRLNTEGMKAKSSLRLLAGRSPDPFAVLVRGSTSLGGLLEQRGFSCVPSPSAFLEVGEPYFDGGYSTERHGSRDGTGLDGVQLELPQLYRDTAEKRRDFSRALSDALRTYFERHYGILLGSRPPAGPANP